MERKRTVTRTKKDQDGDILALCNPGDEWSTRSKEDAIRDIESGEFDYYVSWPGNATDVKVVSGPNGKYLRTDRDSSGRNNLQDLPDC